MKRRRERESSPRVQALFGRIVLATHFLFQDGVRFFRLLFLLRFPSVNFIAQPCPQFNMGDDGGADET